MAAKPWQRVFRLGNSGSSITQRSPSISQSAAAARAALSLRLARSALGSQVRKVSTIRPSRRARRWAAAWLNLSKPG